MHLILRPSLRPQPVDGIIGVAPILVCLDAHCDVIMSLAILLVGSGTDQPAATDTLTLTHAPTF